MALSGALKHPKTRQLARLMKIELPYALGILEALWHVTAAQAPCGDIGRQMGNEEIAEEIHFRGNADVLIKSLVESGLLDLCDECRLYVHDWHEHAPQFVRRKVERLNKSMEMKCLKSHVVTSYRLIDDSSKAGTSAGTGTGIGNSIKRGKGKSENHKGKRGETSFSKSPVADWDVFRAALGDWEEARARFFFELFQTKEALTPSKYHYADWTRAAREWDKRDPEQWKKPVRKDLKRAMQGVSEIIARRKSE